VWLREILAEGRVVLSHDNQIRYDPASRLAILETNGRVFIVRGARPHAGLADLVVRGSALIHRILKRTPGPFVAIVRAAETHDTKRVEVRIIATREEIRLDREQDADE
jgi:hypothetical protein